jgi:integrase
LIVWQSGVEINRVLSLLSKDVLDPSTMEIKTETPLRLQFLGRKKHRRPYSTFLGRDSVNHLKLAMGRWTELNGKLPTPSDYIFPGKPQKGFSGMDPAWLNTRFRESAIRLHSQGLVKNGDPESWHTHNLRHSFRTECAHSGVEAEISEYWLGHVAGIAYLYNHQGELHPDELAREYAKVEPFVSLDHNKTTMREEHEKTEKSLLRKVLELEKKIDAILSQPSVASARQGPAGDRTCS